MLSCGACGTACCKKTDAGEVHDDADKTEKPLVSESVDAIQFAEPFDKNLGTYITAAKSGELSPEPLFPVIDGTCDSSMVEFRSSESDAVQFEVVHSLPSAAIVKRSNLLSSVSTSGGLGIGDLIMEVEGVSGGGNAMVEALEAAQAKGTTVSLRVARRPATFEARITRSGPHWKKLGFTVSPDKMPSVLWVGDVKESGLIPSWNDAHPHLTILSGDVVVAVNEISSNPMLMIKTLKGIGEGEVITLKVAVCQ